jgi:hypothetical protein
MPSTAIRSYRYDAARRKLQVRFLSAPDVPYIYLDVPADIYAALQQAPSKGAFVNRVVKQRFRYIRLEPGPPNR